jgi:hypothetical protein
MLSASGQVSYRNYDVKNDEDVVGSVNAVKRVVGDEAHYEVKSDVTISMIIKVNIVYSVSAVYKNAVLQTSKASIYVNGKLRHSVVAKRQSDKYELVVDGELRYLAAPIVASSATLYFQRPDGIRDIFSETSGVLKSLSKISIGRFELIDLEQSSDLNTYTYSNSDLLDLIVVERFLLPTLKLIRLDN